MQFLTKEDVQKFGCFSTKQISIFRAHIPTGGGKYPNPAIDLSFLPRELTLTRWLAHQPLESWTVSVILDYLGLILIIFSESVSLNYRKANQIY